MLIKWLDNRSASTVHHFNAPKHLLSSKEYKETLKYHRNVFLTQEKARIGPKYFSKEIWAGVLPRLKGMRGFKAWTPGTQLQMEYESNVQYGDDRTDIARIQLSGTPAERDVNSYSFYLSFVCHNDLQFSAESLKYTPLFLVSSYYLKSCYFNSFLTLLFLNRSRIFLSL